jgi:hypothetical protein
MAMLTTIGGSAIAASASTPVVKQANSPIVTKCKADLAKRLKIQPEGIKVVEVQAVTWPTPALGMPEVDRLYVQVRTPGSRVIMEAGNRRYLYTTSSKACRYGGPVLAWSYSMLYLQPLKDEPNLNGDLYQCSLIGTNPVRLASAVTDYYPQDKGLVVVKRRTSRSGHDLLYVRASKPGKEVMLHHAMDFGNAAVNKAQDRWAAFVKPGLGVDWTIVIGDMQGTTKTQTLPMPSDARPGKIAWSDDTLMVLSDKAAFVTTPGAEAPVWKQIAPYYFPGWNSFVLNKSESLEISQVTEGGKPAVEVARVWFTGERTVVARISDFTMEGSDLLSPYAFIWGEKGSRQGAYAVDILTGESLSSFPTPCRSMKPFSYPPYASPMAIGL